MARGEMEERFERDGYIIARNLLDAPQIARLREILTEHFAKRWEWEGLGRHQPAAAFEIPAIGWIFSHPGIIAVTRALTQSDRPVFTANCDAHMDMLSWWHKDTSEGQGGCFEGNYFDRDSVRVLRAGIYLQDHDTDGRGLHVRVGSHRTRSLDQGRHEILRTRAGDVVFFDIRLTHAGQFADPVEQILLRLGRKLRLPAAAAGAKDVWRRAWGRQRKLSIFCTYGAPGSDTDQYCRFQLAARRRRGGAEDLPPHLVQELEASGVICGGSALTANPI